ncbi:MAG TPA: HEAT repeat domain-containing protein [Coleofasciculaceae cyanobacterium]
MNTDTKLNALNSLEWGIDTSTSISSGRIVRVVPVAANTQPPKVAERVVRIIQVVATTQLQKVLESPRKQESLGASTELHETLNSLYSKIEAIFWAAKGEFFEDGMESELSRQLNSVVKEYSNEAIEAITCLIVYEKVNPEVAGEALRWLGRIEHPETYEYRRWLLERSLTLNSTRVRDGAILGLASMDDKHAIPYLKQAIEREQCAELKVDMEQVLEQLESLR